MLTGVLIALLALTALTVFTAREVHLGETGNLTAAIVIAIIKATLVGAFFMHLLHDKRLNVVVVFFCLLGVATFLMLTLTDLGSRDAVDPMRAVWTRQPNIVEKAHENAEAVEAGPGEGAPEAEAH